MQTGLFAPLVSPPVDAEYVRALGSMAEERSYSTVWLGEHVVLFDEYESIYPYMEDGKMPAVASDQGLLEPFTTLAYLAATTSTLLLGTGICILPQRNPVVVAKELSNLDWLSGGRVRFGVGIGWQKEEYEALATPWERRAERNDEYVQVVRSLWEDEVSGFRGEFYELPASRMYPKPRQPGGPPIIFGGDSDAALRRVARIGDGWYAFSMTPATLGERLTVLDRHLAAQGRSRSDIHLVVCPYMLPVTPDDVAAYEDLGVDEIVLMVFARDVAMLGRRFDSLEQRGLAP